MSLPCLFHTSECFPWKITLKVWKHTPKHFHLFGPWITLKPPRRPAREPKSLHDPSSALAKAVCLTLWSDVIVKNQSKFRRWCADDTCWTSNSSGVWKLEMYVMFESHPKNVCKWTGHASRQKLHMFKKSSNIPYVFRPIGEKANLWFHVTKVWGSPCWQRGLSQRSTAGVDFAQMVHSNLHQFKHWKHHLEGFCWPSPSPKFKGPEKNLHLFLQSPTVRCQRTSQVESQCEAAAPAHQKCPEPAMQERIGGRIFCPSRQYPKSKMSEKKSWKHHHWRFKIIQFARVVSYHFLSNLCAVLVSWKGWEKKGILNPSSSWVPQLDVVSCLSSIGNLSSGARWIVCCSQKTASCLGGL